MKFRLVPLLSVFLFCSVADAADEGLDSEKEKFSYAFGFQMAAQMRNQGLDLDPNAAAQAVFDVLSGSQPKLTGEEMQAVVQAEQQRRQTQMQAVAQRNLQAGQDFLKTNQAKKGVTVLPSGLQYKVLKKGSGNKPKVTDTVSVNYRGALINGVEFDSSLSRGQPAEFPVKGVIKGWQEIIPMMEEGAKWEVVIPPDMAYGPRGAGPSIGPNETLVFEIELLAIK